VEIRDDHRDNNHPQDVSQIHQTFEDRIHLDASVRVQPVGRSECCRKEKTEEHSSSIASVEEIRNEQPTETMEDGEVRGHCEVCQSRLWCDESGLSRSYCIEDCEESEEEVRTECARDGSTLARSEYRIREGSRQDREAYDHPEGKNHRGRG
ncbi:hypothetical protein PMAYCL1PPCAC_26464, partial [Pristionchus mayeri]